MYSFSGSTGAVQDSKESNASDISIFVCLLITFNILFLKLCDLVPRNDLHNLRIHQLNLLRRSNAVNLSDFNKWLAIKKKNVKRSLIQKTARIGVGVHFFKNEKLGE